MKIAYGISVYKDPVHLARLVRTLFTKNTYFFIHVDSKVDATPFEDALRNIPSVRFVKERYNIFWGGWNQVKYQLLFLKEMLNSPEHISRLFVITGQDYPLWSNQRIFFESQNYPKKIWMKGLNLTKLKGFSHMKRFLSIPHYFRDTDFHNDTIRHYITGIQRELFLRLLPNVRKPYVYIDGIICDIWQSSGYFSCNREVAMYILSVFKRNPKMVNYFKHSFVPEEIAIPTIIFNSKYKDNAMVSAKSEYEGLSSLATLHQFFYYKEIKTYTYRDYNELISSDKMFCRKVVTGLSDSLMDMIDEFRG